jgi:hypothetical protein
MADVTLLDLHREVEEADTLELLAELLGAVPDAGVPYLERANFSNPMLAGYSPRSLLELLRHDDPVKEAHGTSIIASALVRVVADQARRIAALEERVREENAKGKPATKKKS